MYDMSLPLSPATQAHCLGRFDFPRLAEPRQGLAFYRLLRRLVESQALLGAVRLNRHHCAAAIDVFLFQISGRAIKLHDQLTTNAVNKTNVLAHQLLYPSAFAIEAVGRNCIIVMRERMQLRGIVRIMRTLLINSGDIDQESFLFQSTSSIPRVEADRSNIA